MHYKFLLVNFLSESSEVNLVIAKRKASRYVFIFIRPVNLNESAKPSRHRLINFGSSVYSNSIEKTANKGLHITSKSALSYSGPLTKKNLSSPFLVLNISLHFSIIYSPSFSKISFLFLRLVLPATLLKNNKIKFC